MEAKNKKNPSLPPIITEIYFTIKKNSSRKKEILKKSEVKRMTK